MNKKSLPAHQTGSEKCVGSVNRNQMTEFQAFRLGWVLEHFASQRELRVIVLALERAVAFGTELDVVQHEHVSWTNFVDPDNVDALPNVEI